MRALKMIGAAVAAFAISTAGLPSIAAADPATPQQIQDATDELAAAQTAYDEADQAYKDAEEYYVEDREYTFVADCYRIYVTNQQPFPQHDQYLVCVEDVEYEWFFVIEPALAQARDEAQWALAIAQSWYNHITTCQNSC